MATGLFLSNGTTDLDSVFEPGSGVSLPQYPRKDNGAALQYAPLSAGSAVAATGYKDSGGTDFNGLWAAKGSVSYLASPGWPSVNYDTSPSFSSGTYTPPPGGRIIPMLSSVREGDHQSMIVRLTFNPDGTWIVTVCATNRDNDYFSYYNTIINSYLTLYNIAQGNFSSNLQVGVSGAAGALAPAMVASGNWLQTPKAGAGSGYVISASFGPVFDYTAVAGTQTGSPYTWYQGLKGASSPQSIWCNGGFIADASGNTYASASNMSLASAVSLCYGWNSSGGFNGNLPGLEGADGVLRWIIYVTASATIANTAGTASVTGSISLGGHVSWEDYSDHGVSATYTGSHDADTAPWSTVNVGAGSQGQWTYGSSGGGGGGGGGGCVVVAAEMFDGRHATDFLVDDQILVTNPYGEPDQDNSFLAPIAYSAAELQPCVEVETRQGATLQMSTTAPIPTREHDFMLAPALLGQQIAIGHRDDVVAGGSKVPFVWDEVIAVRDIGLQWVQHLTVNHEHHCFWATTGREWFVLHHNLKALT